MIESVLLFYRKDCSYSKKLIFFLRKNTKKLYLVEDNKNKKILNIRKLKKKKYSYIFCFRSFYILKKDLIKKAKIAAINFHPGPPNYKGIGCLNYAIYEESKYYGTTCHLINERIDSGKIIDVKKFKLSKKYSVDDLQKKTYTVMLKQGKQIIKNLSANKKYLERKIIENKNIKWIKRMKNRKQLNKFYEIKTTDTKLSIDKKIKSTYTNLYKPYIKFHGYLFEYKKNK
mgnify:FL=1|jgi:methionyl-tRNA formyltransferase